MTHNSVKLLLLLMIMALVAGCAGPEQSALEPAGAASPVATGAVTVPATDPVVGFDCATAGDLPVAECQALVELYLATDGANWSNQAGWLDTAAPCSWYGITCVDGHIDAVELSTNNLHGPVPGTLSDLPALRFIDLHNNSLSGALPPDIGRLSRLAHLDLSANEISGSIPPTFGNLSALEGLDLSDNGLTGAIPVEIGNLAALRNLYLAHNQLGDAIPESLAGIASLESIRLHDNRLEGEIPFGLGELAALSEIDLSFNQLTGVAPSALFQIPAHRLWGNQLDGTIFVGEDGRQDVNFLGAMFSFNRQVADSVWAELAPPREGAEGPGTRWVPPEHIEFTFVPADGPTDHAPLGLYLPPEGQMHIYPTAGLNEEVQPVVAGLQQLLAERPDLTPYGTVNPVQGDDHPGLTMLPPSNAQQTLRAQPQYLEFAEGSGVRYLTQLSQGIEPVNNQSLFYTFQGLTDDGNTYVAAYFPVALPDLPDSPQVSEKMLATMAEDWQGYVAQTLALLNEQPSNAFTPDLAVLDALVSSISVAGTQAVPALELIWPESEASVDSQPILQWESYAGAVDYQVIVIDDDAFPPVVILEQATTDTSLAVSPALEPGSYSWTVRALDSTDRILAELNSSFMVGDAP